MDQTTIMPTTDEDSTSADRFTYAGSHFPWWMLVIWVVFILSSTVYMIQFMLPNLSRWIDKPPYDKFIP
jgi:hypothetical protein